MPVLSSNLGNIQRLLPFCLCGIFYQYKISLSYLPAGTCMVVVYACSFREGSGQVMTTLAMLVSCDNVFRLGLVLNYSRNFLKFVLTNASTTPKFRCL